MLRWPVLQCGFLEVMVKKILVVDDEVDLIRLLKYNLEKEGYETLSASDVAVIRESTRFTDKPPTALK